MSWRTIVQLIFQNLHTPAVVSYFWNVFWYLYLCSCSVFVNEVVSLLFADAMPSPESGHTTPTQADALFSDLRLLSLEKQLNIELKVIMQSFVVQTYYFLCILDMNWEGWHSDKTLNSAYRTLVGSLHENAKTEHTGLFVIARSWKRFFQRLSY